MTCRTGKKGDGAGGIDGVPYYQVSNKGIRVVSEKREHSGFESRISGSSRLFALDALRGLIMILMALDHASHFIAQKHSPGEYWGGNFPVYDSSLAFLTRFVTHPVAPGFSFLMGAGMLLFANSHRKRGWSEWAIMRHFLIRGVFLIALQLLVINRVWELSPGGFPKIYIGVLVALGGGMILGSPLLRLQPMVLFLVSIALFVGTEFLHPDPSLWGALNVQPVNLLLIRPGGDANLWSNYPILPWLETVVFGILFGHWLVDDSRKAFKRAFALGGAFLLGFIILRSLDGFGNIRPRIGDGWMDYLNVVKYPPAMTFTLLTMGLNLIILGLFARAGGWIQRFLQPLVAYGRAPLFFYLLHLFLYAGLGLWLTPSGTSLPAMFPYWILGLLIIFPSCRWYGGFKQKQPINSVLHFLLIYS